MSGGFRVFIQGRALLDLLLVFKEEVKIGL